MGMRCSEVESAAETGETGLQCICVYIHPAPNSSWSEDNRFSPAKGMTSDWSEQFFVNINNTIYDRNVTGASDKSMLELHNLLRIFNFNHLQKILSFTLLECY